MTCKFLKNLENLLKIQMRLIFSYLLKINSLVMLSKLVCLLFMLQWKCLFVAVDH